MAPPKYTEIPGGEEEDARALQSESGRLGIVPTLLLVLVAASGFVASVASVSDYKVMALASVESLYRAGHALESAGLGGGDAALLVNGEEEASCACDCESLAVEGLSEDAALAATPVPSYTRYWDLFWTDGTTEDGDDGVDESYVWTTDEEDEGILATVLIDTYGYAKGLDIDLNGTTVYFTVDGCIAKVDRDGLDLKEFVCYDGVDDDDTNMEGLAIYDLYNKLYWVDSVLGAVYSTALEGNDGTYETVHSGLDSPSDVAVDETAGKLYVADAAGVYKMDMDASDVVQVLSTADTGLTFRGLDVDATNRNLYFTAGSTVYGASLFDPSGDYEALYEDLDTPVGVAVDGAQDLLFFTDETGVYRGDLSGGLDKVFVAEIADARFVAVLSESAPTPAPTPVPTSEPSFAPTSRPSSSPTAKPTHAPTSTPTSEPTRSPTSHPSRAPAPVPTSTPTSKPTFVPSPQPSKQPTAAPSFLPTTYPTAAPSPKPTRTPTSSPTSAPTLTPTTDCFINMNSCGYCDGSAGYECKGEAPPTAKPVGSPTNAPVAALAYVQPSLAPTTANYVLVGHFTFSTCATTCEDSGLEMPCIQDSTENEELREVAVTDGETKIWIGYESPEDEESSEASTWVWSDASCSSSYTQWATDQPDDWNSQEDCAEMVVDSDDSTGASEGEWIDGACSNPRACYCQPAGDTAASPTRAPSIGGPTFASSTYAYWDFNSESENVLASVTGNLTATLHGDATITGRGVKLDGTSGTYMTLQDLALETWTTNDFTIEVCVVIAEGGGGAWSRLFDFGPSETVNMFLTPSIASTNEVEFEMLNRRSGKTYEDKVDAVDVDTSGWTSCLAATSEFKIYDNGALLSDVCVASGDGSSCLESLGDMDMEKSNYFIGKSNYLVSGVDAYLNATILAIKVSSSVVGADDMLSSDQFTGGGGDGGDGGDGGGDGGR